MRINAIIASLEVNQGNEAIKQDAIKVLSDLGYKVDLNNFDQVLLIAKYKELYNNRFNCSFNNISSYLIEDRISNQVLIKTEFCHTFGIVLDTLQGEKLFRLDI